MITISKVCIPIGEITFLSHLYSLDYFYLNINIEI
jgi:hypothetical protein